MTYVSPSKVFAHMERLMAWKQGGTPAPVTLEWDLSNACSLGCQSCHFAHTHTAGPWAGLASKPTGYAETGVLADVRVVKRALGEAAAAGVQAVVWSGGGEPTLHPAWQEIVREAANLGLQQGMYTLGGHLSQSDADLLAEALSWVVVSLDAHDAATYATEKRVKPERFEAACEGIRRLAAAPGGAVIGVSFLLHHQNWHRAARMHELGRQLGATYVTFRPTIDTDVAAPGTPVGYRQWITSAMPTLEWLSKLPDVECDPDRFAQYQRWTGHGYSACHGIKLAAAITPDGRIWVCPQRRGVEGSCVGDLRVESFTTAWARHPGSWTDFSQCRAMCRMHLVNQQLAPVFAAHQHEAFV